MSVLAGPVGIAFAGAAFGVGLAYACYWTRRRWTWPLLGALASWALIAAVDFNLSWSHEWAVVPALGCLLAAGALLRWDAEDRRKGGSAAERLRSTVGPLDALRRRVQRRVAAPRADARTYLLGADRRGLPVRVRFGRQSGRHQLLLGAAGSGKTNALVLTVCRHIQAGFGAICIEFKGEREVGNRLMAEASLHGRPFRRFTLEGGDHWNPLRRGSRSELKDKLIASEDFSERHYEAMYERYLLNLFWALEDRGEPPDLAEVVRLVDPDELALVARDLQDEAAADRLSRYLERLADDQRRHLRGLQDRLALLVEGEVGEYLSPSDESKGEIDLLQAVEEGAVTCFSLNSSRYPQTAKLIGNLLLQDLKTVCGTREDDPEHKRPAIVAIDEFGALDQDHVAGLFQRARSAAVSLLLSTQEVADLRRVAEGFEDQVLGNVEVLIALRQNVPESAELVASFAGTEEVWEHTFQTDHRLGVPKHRGGESGLGTMARGEQFAIHPNVLKRLAVGRAALVTKNPHEARVVAIERECRS